MKPDIKKLWVEALRSGEFKKTKGVLRDAEGNLPEYCCLGVLSELYRRATGEGCWMGSTFLNSDCILSRPVERWAGLVEPDPHVLSDGCMRPLSVLNDGIDGIQEKSFLQIANMIEASL